VAIKLLLKENPVLHPGAFKFRGIDLIGALREEIKK